MVLKNALTFMLANRIEAVRRCSGQCCGGSVSTGKVERAVLCDICIDTLQTYLGYNYRIEVYPDGVPQDDETTGMECQVVGHQHAHCQPGVAHFR